MRLVMVNMMHWDVLKKVKIKKTESQKTDLVLFSFYTLNLSTPAE